MLHTTSYPSRAPSSQKAQKPKAIANTTTLPCRTFWFPKGTSPSTEKKCWVRMFFFSSLEQSSGPIRIPTLASLSAEASWEGTQKTLSGKGEGPVLMVGGWGAGSNGCTVHHDDGEACSTMGAWRCRTQEGKKENRSGE